MSLIFYSLFYRNTRLTVFSFSVIAVENKALVLIDLIAYQKAVKNLESELNLSEENFLHEKNRSRALEQQYAESTAKHEVEEIQKLKEQIATKDKIINDLKHFKYFTNQEIESKDMKIMEQALMIKKLQEENEVKNTIIQDHSKNKARIDDLHKILPSLKKECLKHHEDIRMHLKKHEDDRKAFQVKSNDNEIKLLQMKKDLDSKEGDYQILCEENESFKEQLAENEKLIRDLERESQSISDIIDQNCQLIKEKEELQTILEADNNKSRAAKRRHEEETLTLQRKVMRLEKDNEELEKTKEENSKMIMERNKIIERQKTNLNIVLDEVKKIRREEEKIK